MLTLFVIGTHTYPIISCVFLFNLFVWLRVSPPCNVPKGEALRRATNANPLAWNKVQTLDKFYLLFV